MWVVPPVRVHVGSSIVAFASRAGRRYRGASWLRSTWCRSPLVCGLTCRLTRTSRVRAFGRAAGRRLASPLGGISVRFLGQAEVGFIAAILVAGMLIRWFEAIQVVIAKSWTYGDEPRQRRTLLWALPIVLTLHSGPWAVAVFFFLSWHLVSGPENLPGFGWGLAAGTLLMAWLLYVGLVRVRRLKSSP